MWLDMEVQSRLSRETCGHSCAGSSIAWTRRNLSVCSITRCTFPGWGLATAVVTTFFAPSRRLNVCNAGHPRPLLYRVAARHWDFLEHNGAEPAEHSGPRNMPLGIMDLTEYDQFDIELETGDCLLTYTDALIESHDADGRRTRRSLTAAHFVRLLANGKSGRI